MSEVKYSSGWMHPDDADKLQKQNQALVEALKDCLTLIDNNGLSPKGILRNKVSEALEGM